MITGFGNNVVSALAADITASQTTIQVMPGAGEAFARLLTYDYQNASNELRVYAKITLTDAGETEFEVCHLTAVNNDLLTVVRGQEGTTAKGWSLNDVVANFATRGSENQFVQIEHLQSGHYTSGVAGGTANALTLDLPASYFLNGSTSWELRTPLVVYPVANNTGPATLQLTMGGRPLGTFKLYKGNKAELTANDILKDVGLVCVLDKTKAFFNVSNPGAIYAGLGTAAFKDIVTSPTDTTAGRVLTVGAGGLLGGARDTTIANELFASFWRDTSIVKSGITIPYDGSPTINYFAVDGANHHAYIGRKAGANPITWVKIFSEFNKPTADDTSAVAKAGDTMTGKLTMNVDGEAIRLKPKTAGSGSYIISQDSVGANHWYVGAGSANNNDVQLVNYKAANNMVQLKADGSVLIAPTNGKNTDVSGKLKTTGEVQSTSPDSFRIAYGNYGTFWRNDGNTLYLMLTSSGDSLGPYNSLRPFAVNLATGDITINKLALVNYANFDARYAMSPSLAGFGGVGTYAFLSCNAAVANGATVAGASLFSSGIAAQKSSVGYGDKSMVIQGSAMAGTWKCLGNQPAPSGSDVGATLYYRIA